MSLIFLNGTTSSGKTSIARELQERLDWPYLYTGIDDAFDTLPLRLHNHPDGFFFDRDERSLIRLNFGKTGLACLKAHQEAVAAIAASGYDVICDEVVLTEQLRIGWFSILDNIDTVFVGVHCSIDVIEQREIERGDRIVGQARGQFEIVHSNMPYDIEIDSSNATPTELADEIIGKLPDSFKLNSD